MGEGAAHNAEHEISVLRDVQMAQEIGSLAAMGIFPKSILVYGLVYYQQGKRQYMLSADPAKLIAFLNDVQNQQYFPSPMESYAERLIVPEGEEERITRQIKLKLARKLQEAYPAQLFAILEQLQARQGNHAMDGMLIAYRNELESVFHVDKLLAFRTLCIQAYLRKNVSEAVYQQLAVWCDERLAQLVQYIPPIESKQKCFYGFAVLEEHEISRCVLNGNLSCIYNDKRKLEAQGSRVTAWHEKWFSVERQESLRSINQQMADILQNIYDEPMIALIEQMYASSVEISAEEIQHALHAVACYGPKAEELVRYYGAQWGAYVKVK